MTMQTFFPHPFQWWQSYQQPQQFSRRTTFDDNVFAFSKFDVSFNLRRQHKVALVMKNRESREREREEEPREKSDTQLFGKPLQPFIIHLIDVNMSHEHFPLLENPFRAAAEYNPHRNTLFVRCANEIFFGIFCLSLFHHQPPLIVVNYHIQMGRRILWAHHYRLSQYVR